MDSGEPTDTPDPTPSDPTPADTTTSPALEAYMARWSTPLDVLALVTLWLIVVPPATMTSNQTLWDALLAFRLGLSLVYAVDLTIRSRLAPHPLRYTLHHPLAIATVFIPTLRVLLSFRLLRSMFQRGNYDRFIVAATLMFANLTLIVYFFERHATGANIRTLGQAIWWAFVTVSTIGYGDYTPVTVQGRIAAVVLMGLGFIVLATVTASISSSFIDQAARARQSERAPTDAGPRSPTEDELREIAQHLRHIDDLLGGAVAGGAGPPSEA